MIRLLLGAFLSAVVLFAWGFVFWAASHVMYRFMHHLPDEDAVTRALQSQNIESGTYLIPFPDPDAVDGADKDKAAALLARHMRGPLVEIIYRKEGLDPLSAQEMIAGFCHFLAASLLAGVLLVMAQPGLPRYPMRVAFVTVIGIFATVAVTFSKPVWFHHPWTASLYEAAYVTVGWLLAGLVLGLVIRPGREDAKSVPAAVSPPAAPPSP